MTYSSSWTCEPVQLKSVPSRRSRLATVEVTSEDPNFPIEFVLIPGPGRLAGATESEQTIGIDEPRTIGRARLEFVEAEM